MSIFYLQNLQHMLKYVLFILLKSRNIPVRRTIKMSDAKMDLNLGNFIDYWIYVDGSYEEKWIKKIRKFVKKKVLIDVGSYKGIYPLSLFRTAKSIYAFEAERDNYRCLVKNIKINKINNVFVHRNIVSDQNDVSQKLFINKINEGMHSSTVDYGKSIQKVKSIKLDNFIKRGIAKKIGLIKIDVEGAELRVLKGLANTIKKVHPPILVEFNKTLAKLSGHDLIQIYEFMNKNSYDAYRLRENRLVELKKNEVPFINSENILFKRG